MVAFLERGDAGADVDHDACAFMAQDGREYAFRVGTRERVVVGVADAGGLDLDQYFAETRAVEVHGFNGEGSARFPGYGGFGFHGVVLNEVEVDRSDAAA
ncbi:hypothetical protein D9M73_69550 [compost metagenome]